MQTEAMQKSWIVGTPLEFDSRIMVGKIVHKRFKPRLHQFKYNLFMVHIFLDECEYLFKGIRGWSESPLALARMKREDYFNPSEASLDTAVREKIQREKGIRPRGRISILTHLRYFGFCINPVTFYICWDPEETYPEFILAEITNTPWGERFAYVLEKPNSVSKNGCLNFEFPKAFHVSPFMPMNQLYRWSFMLRKEGFRIHMTNSQENEPIFFSNLSLRAISFTQKNCNRVLVSFCFMTARVLWGIYIQAFILWLKKTPFYPHPNPG